MTPRILAGVVALAFAVAGTAMATVPARGAVAAARTPEVVRGVTPTSIKVGGLGDALRFGGADLGAKARFARQNTAGGVNGRTIDYVGLRDDSGQRSNNEQVATRLLRDDEVFALVPVVAPDLGAARVLVDQKVPYFGWAISSNFCGNQYGFGFSGCLFPPGGRVTSNAWGVLVKTALGAQVPTPTAVVLTENTTSGQFMLDALSAGAKAAGLTVVSATSTLPVPPVGDYGALAKSVMAGNAGNPPDVVFLVGSYSNVVLSKQALRDAGFTGLLADAIEYDPDLVAAAGGTSVMLQTAALETAAANPAVQQLVTDVRAIAPAAPIDESVIAGYWSADLFITAVKRAGKNLTVANVMKKANNSFTYRVRGTVGPTKFPAAHDAPTPCGTLVRSDGAAFTVEVPYTCGQVVPVRG